jgi:hypothetical protein
MYNDGGTGMIFNLVGIAIAAVIAFFVYKDANERGMNGVLWGILVFLFCIIALPIYLLIRKPKTGGGGTGV